MNPRSVYARFNRSWARLLTTTACFAAIAVTAHAGTSLISSGSPVRFLVPTDDSLGTSWTSPSFDDSSWTEGANGVGYQAGLGGYEAQIVADSISEWSSAGQQGENYWSYGYYDKTGDADATYQAGDFRIFPRSAGAWGVNNFWDGAAWNWYPDNVPWDNIGQTTIHPNGINNGAEHWVIRRWRSTFAGPVTFVFRFSKASGNPNGAGVTGKILQNGTEIFSRAVAGSDTVGYTVYVNATVAVGDLIDFAQTPIGPDGDTGDGSDNSAMTARVYAGTIVEPIATTDSVNDWSASGTQGYKGWFYGFYNKTGDGNGVYDADDFNMTDLGWAYNGTEWKMNPNNPPWTTIGQSTWHPAGDSPTHWAIRRWVSTVAGDMYAHVQFAKDNTGCGNGTTLHVFHNGAEKLSRTIAGGDGTGFSADVVLAGVAVGDRIDFALDPLGTDATYLDGCDSSRLVAKIYPGAPFQPGLQGDIATDVQTEMKGVSSSVYLRFPFEVADPSALQTLKLKLKWNDGYVAYLNGTAIDKKNAPTVISGDAVADSVADWSATGEQGVNGWSYGYYNRTADDDGVFQPENLTLFDSTIWNGNGWDMAVNTAPWTELYQENVHPNGTNNAVEHWVIRRWSAQSDGTFKVRIKFAKTNPNCGDGVIAYIFHNGSMIYSNWVAGTDSIGRDDVVDIPNEVLWGDTIDIAIAPGPNDGCDGSKFSAVIFGGEPFTPWDAAAIASRTAEQTIAADISDLTALIPQLVAGQNVLAIHGLNASANDDNFLIAAEIVANNLPTAVADSLPVNQDVVTEIPFSTLLANDTDPDGDALQIVGVTPGGVTTAGGSIILLGDKLAYTPAAGFSGVDTFTYQIADASGVPVQATVQLGVNLQQSYASFDSSLPGGASIFGLAGLNPTGGINDSGVLRITDGVNGQAGTFVTDTVLGGQPVTEFALQAMVRIGASTCCTAGRNELRPADGMSFNFGPDIPLDSTWNAGWLEEGIGSGLRLSLDTWDNGAADAYGPDTAPAISLYYGSTLKASAPLDGWRDDNTPDAGMIPLDPQNGAPLTLYTDARDQTFVRVTSGANAGQIYQCHQGDGTPDLSTLPDGKLAGPTIYVGLAGDANSSLVPPAPGPGYIALIQRGTYAFAIKASNALASGYAGVIIFNQPANGETYIVPGMGAPAALIPTVMIGHSRGLAIAGVADASALVEGAPGADVSIERVTPPVAPWAPLAWILRSDGGCDVWWKGVKVINNAQTGYVPTPGKFGIGGRTGGANEAHWVDDLTINYFTLPGPVQIVQQPASITVVVDRDARFEVFAAGDPPLSYEWSVNGTPVTGVNGPVLTLNAVTLADDQTVVNVVVSNPGGSVTSQDAILTVILDDVPPSLVSINGSATLNQFTLKFSEPLLPESGGDFANYGIDGLNLDSVTLLPDNQTVVLMTSLQTPGASYTVSYNDINDPYYNAVSGTAIGQAFVLTPGLVRFDYFDALSTTDNNLDTTLLADPRYPNNPTATYYITAFDSTKVFPDSTHEGYGARLTGAFVPPADGNYVFYMRSDDLSRLFLNPTGIDPAGKVLIAEDTACCMAWNAVASLPQPLTAGQAYYLEAIYKEGTGGDYLTVGVALEGQPAPSDVTRDALQGGQVAGLYNPVGAELNITQQPQDVLFVSDPLAGTGAEFSQNFDTGDGGYTVANAGDRPTEGPWVYDATAGAWSANGAGDACGAANSSLLTSPALTVTKAGSVRLSFSHRYSFEYDGATRWDGGQVRLSKNGGAFEPVLNFTANGYVGRITGSGVLNNQMGFNGESLDYASGAYIESVAELGEFSIGDTIAVQFVGSWDECTTATRPNWVINSVAIDEGGVSAFTTFSVAATGSVGGQATTVYYQWQKDIGAGFVDIPGANAASYTFAPLMADNGMKLRARVIIPGSMQFSGEATLTTFQLNTAPSFAKGADQTSQCAAGPQTVAGWATDIQPHSIPQVSASFSSDFASGPPAPGPAPWTTDFSAGVPVGTVPSGTTPPYVDAEGSLHITDQVNSQANYWTIPSLGSQTVTTFNAQWKMKITGVGGADGLSFNVGENVGLPGTPEEGNPTGLAVCVDTYNNGAGEAGLDIKYNGAQLGFLSVGGGPDGSGSPAELALDTFTNASVNVDASGLVTFRYANFEVTGQIPGYTGLTINQYVFAARTGGANENCWIDDVSISLPPLVGAPAPAGTHLYGNAYIANGSLHLTDAANGLAGSIVIDDILGGGRLGSFEMTFNAQVGGGTAPPADGFSVSVANDLPNGTWSEEGAGTGLTVSFDSYDNGGGEAPAIDVMWGGVMIAHTLVPSIETGGNFVPVSIKLDADGTLDVVAAGTPVYTDLATGFVPILGARFGLSARTGGLNENCWIDDLSILAYPVDASTAEVGQSVQFIVSNDNPTLFDAQPAIAPNGTLTYTPAISGSGVANVSVVAKDDGGTANGGRDTSAAQTFTITIGCVGPTFTTTQIGGGPLGSITANPEPGSYTVEGGGSDIWDMSDEFTFHYINVNGDFDVRARVDSVEVTARWPKAGIMARETLAGDSRMAFAKVSPAGPITPAGNCSQTEGAADVSLMYRTWIPGAGGNGGQHEDRIVSDPGYPTYKWIRLQRVGSVMKGFASADGVNWMGPVAQDTANWLVPLGGAMTPFNQDALLGLAVSRHGCTEETAPGGTATTEFRELATQPPVILVQPASIVSAAGTRATFSVTTDGSYTSVQWRKNGVNIPGARSTIYTTPVLTADNDAEVYSVELANQFTGDSVTSDEAMLTVTGEFPGDALTHRWNFNADANDSIGGANGTLINGAALDGTAVAMNGNQQYVDLPNGLFDTYSSITLEAWATDNNSGAWARLWDFGNTSLGEDPLQSGPGYGGANYMFFTWPIGDLTGVRGAYKQTTTGEQIVGDLRPRPSTGVKHHIVWVQDAAAQSARIYIDGALKGQSFFTFKPSDCGPYLNNWLGRSMYQGDAYFNGSIDEFRVFNAPVPAEYVAASFALGPEATLTAGPVSIAQEPADVSVIPMTAASFQVVLNGTLPYSMQWFRDGAAIPGATSPVYTFQTVQADNGATFYVEVSNPTGTATSRTATLEVRDEVPPVITGVSGDNTFANVIVTYNEFMDVGTAGDAANYAIDGGLSISTATLQADGKTVVLTTDLPMADNTVYTLTVSDVADLSGNQLSTTATFRSYVITCSGGVLFETFNTGAGTAVANLTSHPTFPNSPDSQRFMATFDTRAELGTDNYRDNYGARLRGMFVPSVSGSYDFYMHNDDGAQLFLNPNGPDPAGKVLVAVLDPSCCQDWPAINSIGSFPAGIPLVAGQAYYIEGLYKEEGGGDYIRVAARLHDSSDALAAIGPDNLGRVAAPGVAGPVVITQQPVEQTVEQNKTATFSVQASSQVNPWLPVCYQWQVNGADIPGANAATYTIPVTPLADDGAVYTCVVSIVGSKIVTDPAVLHVVADATPPTVVSVSGDSTFANIIVIFDEVLDSGTAGDFANYSIDGGLQINLATLQADGKTVILNPDLPLAENTEYNLTVSGVLDLSGVNAVADTTIAFRSWVSTVDGGQPVVGTGPVLFEAWNLPLDVAATINTISYFLSMVDLNTPDVRYAISGFNSRLAPGYADNSLEHYGARMRAYFVPDRTGNWIFHISSDDPSQLFLNPNGPDPAGKVMIAEETGCCRTLASIASAPIALQAGQVYYIEMLYKEGTGGDFGQAYARLDSDPAPGGDGSGAASNPTIPSNLLLPVYPAVAAGTAGQVVISQQPVDQTVEENQAATFTIAAAGSTGMPVTYQWRLNGAAIPGANSSSYTIPQAILANDGETYDCIVRIVGGMAQSAGAVLHVVADATAPQLVSASGTESLSHVVVRFSEALDSTTAADSANYSVDGLSVDGAALNADGRSVTLLTSPPQTPGTVYTVTVNSVLDLSTANAVVDGSTASFTAWVFTPGVVRFDYFAGLNQGDNSIDNTLLADPRYPNNPTATYYITSFNSRNVFPNDSVEGYGARLTGVFVPPADGSYIFYMWSDDSSRLFLNPGGIDPAGKVLIAEEVACCNAWGSATEIKSLPQPLTGGQQYYIEAIYKEGTGGDYIFVGARLEGEPSPANTTTDTIQSVQLGVYADPTGASITIVQQPADQVFAVNPAGGAGSALLSQDFNAGDGGFTVSGNETTGPWVYDAAGNWSASGHTDCITEAGWDSALTSPVLTVTKPGYVKVSFSHAYNFEYDGTRWDGGQVRVSINGGPFVTVQGGSFTAHGYDGVITSGASINGQQAFNGDSGGMVTSEADLGFRNVGDTIQVQFFGAWDQCYTPTFPAPSWTVDSVTLNQGELPSTVTFSVAAVAERNFEPWPNISYQWQKNTGSGFADIFGAVGASYTFPPTLADNGTLFRVKCIIPGVVEISREALLTVGLINTPPSFTLVPPPASDSGSGPQTVPGVAQDILPCTTEGTIIKARIGLNFAANDNGAALGLAPTEIAGVVAQGNWNNLNDANGSASSLLADYTGRAKTTAASVTWSCPNTWASTGRGEENNAFPAGPDRKMMTGYLDTDNAALVATVTVSGLSADFTTGGYDVIVYALGGTTAGRWGAYSIGTATQILNSAASPTGFVLDPGVDANDTGNYAIFRDLTGSSFTLIANAVTAVGNGTRAPINGVQIVAKAAIPPAAPVNVLAAGDPIVLVNGVNDGDSAAGAPPAGEIVDHAIDRVTQKYLNFLDLGSGFAVTPSFGLSVVTGIRLYTANDAEERDPASYVLEGSTAGSAGPWTVIAQGPLALPSGRNAGGSIPIDPATQFNQLLTFANSTAYSSYRVTFPTLKNAASANSMQIGEVELLGTEFAQKDCGPESSQTVQFVVSNDNPALFSVQPAISPNGTLTYTAACCGQAQVTVVAVDNGGTAFGDDTSDPQTFTLTVNCVNHPPVVADVAAQTPQDRPMSISLVKLLADATDVDCGQILTVSAAGPTSANGGTVALTATGVTYTPVAGYSGPDTFPFTVSDGNGGTTTAAVRVTVLPANGLTPNIYKVTVVGGNYVIGFAGRPGTTYAVQRAPSVTGPWATVATIVIGSSGVAEYTDSDPSRPNPVFYRAIPQP